MLTVKAKKILPDLYPKSWEKQLFKQKCDILEFDNIGHFKQYLKKIELNKNGSANRQTVPFATALEELLQGVPVISAKKFSTIKQEVKSILHKRGLISENIYEGYEYDIAGEVIDIAKYIAEDPECMLKPKYKYKSYFYEMFISAAYLANVSDTVIKNNIAKILATVQLLEQEHIYIKITIVAASQNVTSVGDTTLMVAIPLFSHKDEKTIDTMSSIINERFFRTFIFGIREDKYKKNLSSGYGKTIDLKETIRLNSVDVEKIAQDILDKVITPGTR